MDPRLIDLRRRIYAAAARQGYSEAEFALMVELHTRALRWHLALARVRVSFDTFIEGMRRAGSAIDAFRRTMEAEGAAFSRYEPSEFS